MAKNYVLRIWLMYGWFKVNGQVWPVDWSKAEMVSKGELAVMVSEEMRQAGRPDWEDFKEAILHNGVNRTLLERARKQKKRKWIKAERCMGRR